MRLGNKISSGVGNNTKHRIAEMSAGFFARYGIKGTTMELVSEELHISKRTIYEYFPDKTALLTESIRICIDNNLKEIRMKIVGSGCLQALMSTADLAYKLFAMPHPAFRRDAAKSREVRELLDTEYRKPLSGIVVGLLTQAKIEGLVVAGMDTAKVMELAEGLLLSSGEEPLDGRNMHEAFLYAVRICLTGICTEKGRTKLETINNQEKQER